MKLAACLAAAARRAALPLVIAAPLLIPTAFVCALHTMRRARTEHPGAELEADRARQVESAPAGSRRVLPRHTAEDAIARLPPPAEYRYQRLLDLSDSLPAPSRAEELDWAEQGVALYRAMDPDQWEGRLAPLPQDCQWQVRRRMYELLLVCADHYLQAGSGDGARPASVKQARNSLDRARAIWSATHAWHQLQRRYAQHIGDSTLARIAQRRASQSSYTSVDYYFAARQAAQRGESEAVDRLLACALQRDPRHLPSLRLWAMELQRRKDYGPACAVASAMIAIWPQDDQAYTLRSDALGHLQLRREAQGDQMQARERRRDPFVEPYWDDRGSEPFSGR